MRHCADRLHTFADRERFNAAGPKRVGHRLDRFIESEAALLHPEGRQYGQMRANSGNLKSLQ